MSRETILESINRERNRQIFKWKDQFDDDLWTPLDWYEMISDYNGWARRMSCMGSYDKARVRLIQVAALAVAALESMERKGLINENSSHS